MSSNCCPIRTDVDQTLINVYYVVVKTVGAQKHEANMERERASERRRGRRKGRKLVEAQHCAANAAQAWLIQQRLLWRPTMRLRGAPSAETRRGEGGARGGGGQGTTRERGGRILLHKKKSTSQNHLTLI